MKKIFLLSAIMFCVATAQAQLEISIRGGVNFSSWSGDDAEDFDGLTSFNAGVELGYPFGGMWGIQGGLNLMGQGASYEGGKAPMMYLRIPVLFQYRNPSGFYAEAGPSLGFLLSAKDKEDGQPEEDIKDLFKSTDLALALGLGYKTKSGFGFGGRYNLGLTDIFEDDVAEVKGNVISLTLFYLFGGDKK